VAEPEKKAEEFVNERDRAAEVAPLAPVAFARWTWRQLTSMKTALILLFLLALGAVPGSVVPQDAVDSVAAAQWRSDHPSLTPVYEKLGLFSVYSSTWFSAIYILLMISLTGLGIVPIAYCLLPRFGFLTFADYGFSPVQAWVGALVFVLSLALFLATHRQLGRNWSQTLELREGHTLVTHGVYRLVRHPMYSAFFLWALAQVLLLQNWIAGPAGFIGFGLLYAFRVGREEELMRSAFGRDYADYEARTKRIVPFIH